MIVYCVDVFVKENHIEEFKTASLENHQNTRKEPGNLRFDVLQSGEDPSKFVLYEVYIDEDAVKAHKETAHYLKWRDTVADWMDQPRIGKMHSVVCPQNENDW